RGRTSCPVPSSRSSQAYVAGGHEHRRQLRRERLPHVHFYIGDPRFQVGIKPSTRWIIVQPRAVEYAPPPKPCCRLTYASPSARCLRLLDSSAWNMCSLAPEVCVA
ncbi:unnamed protein product, partial [Sphacelaria rigidula]